MRATRRALLHITLNRGGIMKNQETYYKYRSLSNLRRFIEILLNQKLYAGTFEQLNDPMEGYFRYRTTVPQYILHELKNKKEKTLICSLSKKHNIGLMWSMYADEHKGCCIECSVSPNSTWEKVEVDYSENAVLLEKEEDATINRILGVKSPQWKYEEEVRFIKITPNRLPLSIKIHKIYLGMKLSSKEVKFYTKLIRKLLSDKINIIQLKEKEIDFGFK